MLKCLPVGKDPEEVCADVSMGCWVAPTQIQIDGCDFPHR